MARTRRRRPDPHHDGGRALGRLASGLLEACCLVALAVVPLYFNPESERAFEPDKLAWLIVLGCAALWALLVFTVEGRCWLPLNKNEGGRARRQRSSTSHRASALHLPVLAWVTVLCGLGLALGTLFSIVPTISLWGVYRRGHGLLAYAALFTLLAAAALTVRRPKGLSRLLYAAVLPVAPISAYALSQRAGIDNITWDTFGASASDRAFASLGNPIFLGAYLVLVLPLFASSTVVAWRGRKLNEAGSGRRFAAASSGCVLGLMAVITSQSRGPALGVLAGAVVFVLAYAAAYRRREVALWAAGLGTAALVVLVTMGGSAGGPGGRLGSLLSASSRTARERLLVWGALESLAKSDLPRSVVGHGPDTLSYALAPHLPLELAVLLPDQVIDRAHNIVWEWWTSAGAIGALAILGLLAAALYTGLRLLGLAAVRSDALLLTLALGVGTAVGAIAPIAAGQSPFAALGLGFGLVAGFVAYCFYRALVPGPTDPRSEDRKASRSRSPQPSRAEACRKAAVVAILASLSGHLVEASLGLPTAAGGLVFWVLIGSLIALAASRGTSTAESVEPTTQAAPASGLFEGLGLAAMAHAPLLVSSRESPFGHPGLWLLVPLTWTMCDMLWPTNGRLSRRYVDRLAILASFLLLWLLLRGVTGGSMLAFGAVLIATTFLAAARLGIGGLRRLPDADSSAGLPRSIGGWARVAVYTIAGVVLAFVGWRAGVAPVLADTHLRSGVEAGVRGDLDGARYHFERAAELWPEQTAYATYRAASYREVFLDLDRPDRQRQAAFDAAIEVLERAEKLVPDEAAPHRLGTLLRDKGDLAASKETRSESWQQAASHYDRALALAPHSPGLHEERAQLYERQGKWTEALADYAAVLEIEPGSVSARLGSARSQLALGRVEGARESVGNLLADGGAGAGDLQSLAKEPMGWPIDPVATRLLYALLLDETGASDEALDVIQEARELEGASEVPWPSVLEALASGVRQ